MIIYNIVIDKRAQGHGVVKIKETSSFGVQLMNKKKKKFSYRKSSRACARCFSLSEHGGIGSPASRTIITTTALHGDGTWD